MICRSGGCEVVCGDGYCIGSESAQDCPADCTRCGDSMCTGNETTRDCPADCTVCGDGRCTIGEDRSSCCADCGCERILECIDGRCVGVLEAGDACESDTQCTSGFCVSGRCFPSGFSWFVLFTGLVIIIAAYHARRTMRERAFQREKLKKEIIKLIEGEDEDYVSQRV